MPKKATNTCKYTPETALQFRARVIASLLATLEERSHRSKAALQRYEVALQYVENAANDDGVIGRLFELVAMATLSQKAWVARQGRTDCYVRLAKPDGKVLYAPAEAKTNGGRIGSLYERNHPKFVVYGMAVCNTAVPAGRLLEPVVMTTEQFLELLSEVGALKSTNGAHPEVAIQASSKALYEALLAYGESTGLWFDPERVYNPTDFE